MSTRAFGADHTDTNTYLPRLLGTRGAITAEHYLSAQAGSDILKAGGNAVDAAVAATLVEGVVNAQMNTIGGECPILVCMASQADKVVTINGNTAAPAQATPNAYRKRGFSDVPVEGIYAAGVPATLGALVKALQHFGRFCFADVAAPAFSLARDGFPVHRGLIHMPRFGIKDLEQEFRKSWPGSAGVYLPNETLPQEGQVLMNPALAAMFDTLINAERATAGSRERGLQAVLDSFYRGDIASEIDRFSRQREGFLARSDLEQFETRIEEPVSLDYLNTTIFKCGPWNQGPVMLQALAILREFDLAAMGHNSADYLHTVIETVKLAFADREQYYGDPAHTQVPLATLLSNAYAKARAALIDPEKANPELRPGDAANNGALLPLSARVGGAAWGPGTVHVDVIDSEGNMASFTPSGGWLMSAEVMPALGFPLGNRLMTFYLEPEHHPNLVAPFKRPRTTISPSLAFRDGKPWMVFGSMGGDQQDQWQLQFLLNCVVFDMPIQAAIEAAKFSSEHFPGFFAPHDFFRNRVRIEPRVAESVRADLALRGHDLEIAADWTEGYILAAARDAKSGVLEAGCDPRGSKGDVFPAFALCW
ncbi:MAG: gamma-glutamyltransferase family protein [Gammaproteobacteria bacterium]